MVRVLEHPRLAPLAVGLACLLCAPCLWLGFSLDDYIGRYVYSGVDAVADRLFWVRSGGYGIANGVPADTAWQIELGFAPWWTYRELLLELFRPLGVLSHWLDMRLWPSNAALQHAHSLLWLAFLVVAVLRLYRRALGALVGGLAALLFALDHTHGFVVGYICNRHALITATLCAVALERHLRERAVDPARIPWRSVAWFALALFSGESALGMLGYLFGYLLFVEHGPLRQRVLAAAPYLGLALLSRVAYGASGFGAHGSGLYIDPGREPLHFLSAFVERAPLLVLGAFGLPPAEFAMVLSAEGRFGLWCFALVFMLALGVALRPLLARDRWARCWALGALITLVPAASTYPHNRQLLFTSFGVFGLLARLWQLHALERRAEGRSLAWRVAAGIAAPLLGMHLFLSPLLKPVTTWSAAGAAPLVRAAAAVGDDLAGRDAVFVTAPDYFAVQLVQLMRRIEGRPLARRWRALAFGADGVVVARTDERTLTLDYPAGILGSPLLELYRDRRLPMERGERVQLEGMEVEVLDISTDGRATRASFRFDAPLDAPSFRFYYWVDGGFVPFTPPALGERVALPGARLEFDLFGVRTPADGRAPAQPAAGS
jgi:hypothetical protein